MRRLRIILGICFAAVAVGGILYLTRHRPYEWYTSAPLDEKGTRLEFLIPRGWHASSYAPSNVILFEPRERPGWWPGWLRRMIPQPDPFAVHVKYGDRNARSEAYKKWLDRNREPYRITSIGNSEAVVEIYCVPTVPWNRSILPLHLHTPYNPPDAGRLNGPTGTSIRLTLGNH